MSEKEVRRLHECWEQPEFKAMFQEYAEEVSDPKHKAESEAYLAQCEAEQRAERDAKNGFLNGRSAAEFDHLKNNVPGQPEAPEGQQLLKPHKGFCIKTWQKKPGKSDFDRELGKVFVNVTQHDDIDPPTAQNVTAPDGRKGQTWSMPHLCSPALKEEKDKAGHVCTVVDIVFNTEVLKRIAAPNGFGERWKAMVAKTALEMVSKLHQLTLDMDEHKILNTKYFGDTGEGPSTMAWKPGEAFQDKDEPPATKQTNAAKSRAPAHDKQPSPATSPSTPSPAPPPATKPAAASATKPPPKAVPAAPPKPRIRAPKYSIVHRGVGDMSAAWGDAKLSTSGRPRELCIKVELPDLSAANEIDLDITERKLDLKHDGAGYALSLPLPYPVLSEQGSAKFDKAKRVLTVTVPVAAAAEPMPVWEPASQGQSPEERAAEEAAEKAAEVEARAATEAAEKARREAERAARAEKARREEEEREARRQAAVAQAEREAVRRAEKATKEKAAAAPKPKPAEPKPATGTAPKLTEEKENDQTTSEWVEVSDAEAAAAKAASPTKARPQPPQEKFKKKQEPAELAPPVEPAPTGKGLPAFSNGLLFELD